MSKVFDKLLASRPVNSTAARVLGRGVHYEPNKVIVQRHWTIPPKLSPITPKLRGNPQFIDLTGQSVGRFTVIGYLGKIRKGQPAVWLVRCACGDYESRNAKAICNPNNRGDRCEKCRHLQFLKRREAYLRNPTAPQLDQQDY